MCSHHLDPVFKLMLIATDFWSCLYWPQHYECYQRPWCLSSLNTWPIICRANHRERTGTGGPYRIYLPRYQTHLCIHAVHIFFCALTCDVLYSYTGAGRFLLCFCVRCFIFVYISRRAVKTHTLDALVFPVFAGKNMTLRWSTTHSSSFRCTSFDRFLSICLPCAAVSPQPDVSGR